MSPEKELAELRKEIDSIDRELLGLLTERFAVTSRVGELKKREGMAAEDTAREEQQRKAYHRYAEELGLDPELALRFHQFLVEETKQRHQSL